MICALGRRGKRLFWFKSDNLPPVLTSFGVDGEEILRVARSDAVTQPTGSGGEIGVLRLDTDDGHVLRRVLHDNRVVDRVRGEGSVVVDVLHLRENDGAEQRIHTSSYFPPFAYKTQNHNG